MRLPTTNNDSAFALNMLYTHLARALRTHIHWPLMRLRRFQNPASVNSPYDIRLTPNWNDTTFRLYCTAAYGYVLSDLLRNISADFVFVDVGANQGLYSMIAAKNPYCRRVYAFEPIADTAKLLALNSQINDCANITIFDKAISDRTGRSVIYYNKNHSGSTSMVRAKSASELLQIDLVDRHFLNNSVGKEATALPIFLKVDVEGYEEVVVKEFFHTNFYDRIEVLFFECHRERIDLESLSDFLNARGFTLFETIGSGRHYDVLTRKENGSLGKALIAG